MHLTKGQTEEEVAALWREDPKFEEDVYVELPEEAGAADDECGKLVYWLYGCRPAAQAWEQHYNQLLESVGYRRSVASPVVLTQAQRSGGGSPRR